MPRAEKFGLDGSHRQGAAETRSRCMWSAPQRQVRDPGRAVRISALPQGMGGDAELPRRPMVAPRQRPEDARNRRGRLDEISSTEQ